jgi:hypothetical protein
MLSHWSPLDIFAPGGQSADYYEPFKTVLAARRITQEAIAFFLQHGPSDTPEAHVGNERSCAASHLFVFCVATSALGSSLEVATRSTDPARHLGPAGEWIALHDRREHQLHITVASVIQRKPVQDKELWTIRLARSTSTSEYWVHKGKHTLEGTAAGSPQLDLVAPDRSQLMVPYQRRSVLVQII